MDESRSGWLRVVWMVMDGCFLFLYSLPEGINAWISSCFNGDSSEVLHIIEAIVPGEREINRVEHPSRVAANAVSRPERPEPMTMTSNSPPVSCTVVPPLSCNSPPGPGVRTRRGGIRAWQMNPTGVRTVGVRDPPERNCRHWIPRRLLQAPNRDGEPGSPGTQRIRPGD